MFTLQKKQDRMNKSIGKKKNIADPDKEIVSNYDCLEPTCRITELVNFKSEIVQKDIKRKEGNESLKMNNYGNMGATIILSENVEEFNTTDTGQQIWKIM
jgi:hypothetical protein